MFNKESKVGEVLTNAVGRDIFYQLLREAGLLKKEGVILNPIVRRMRLKHLSKLFKKYIDEEIIDVLCEKMNLYENEELPKDNKVINKTWWREGVFYQIYPRSFKDSNNDGIGDINGVISKLGYLKDLGVDIIWLSPIYDSPNDDYGYDIRNYFKVMKEFGTMEELEKLIYECHKRGMRIIMDLVINHTSDEHEWFKESCKSKDNPYRDYYIWRKGKGNKEEPNNWESLFGGSAWKYHHQTKEYYLHLFTEKQVDLNWENNELREKIYYMVNWWLNKGIDGFRLDVINFISKKDGLPNGNRIIGEVTGFMGIENYVFGPKVHKFINELNRKTYGLKDTFTVGECNGIGLEVAKYFIHEKRSELSTVFNFDHMNMPGKNRWDDYEYDLNYLKEAMIKLQKNTTNSCWFTLFTDNHDSPRFINKVTGETVYHNSLSKLLCVLIFTLKGVPFIYQGQEIGMRNPTFKSIDELRDKESLYKYKELCSEKKAHDEIMKSIYTGTRDNSRIPMIWSDEKNGGFSNKEPWIRIGEYYRECNVKEQEADNTSVQSFFKKMIALRKSGETLIYGDFKVVNEHKKDQFIYKRLDGNREFLIILNLKNRKNVIRHDTCEYELVLCNYNKKEYSSNYSAYESRIYKKKFK
ncbi:alpha-glucosidase [Oceanirhabdus sp. W0125-5]|uniref:alpha-glucosidase n=1 Tax=Oceanirhabdus sp. W0125-5 TaxID=2999116 RepID=UPI0022F2BB0B|nr:alpha-glucosidase [Oceanirhabdus sp. W0125-5]WBW95520.1 alpha-glucosidase [Oceanirhabdus sp. W0125-5]